MEPRFDDVSCTFLIILIPADIYEGGILIIEEGRYTIFDEELEGYFWKYDNKGLKHLQLRFYPVPSNIT